MIHVHPFYAIFLGQGQRSTFKVTGRKCCRRCRCYPEWGLFSFTENTVAQFPARIEDFLRIWVGTGKFDWAINSNRYVLTHFGHLFQSFLYGRYLAVGPHECERTSADSAVVRRDVVQSTVNHIIGHRLTSSPNRLWRHAGKIMKFVGGRLGDVSSAMANAARRRHLRRRS